MIRFQKREYTAAKQSATGASAEFTAGGEEIMSTVPRPAEALRGGLQTRSFGPGEPPGFSGSLGPQRNSRNFLSAGENALP